MKKMDKEIDECTCENETEEHTCPYSVEIYGNHELCTCCDFCTSNCSNEI